MDDFEQDTESFEQDMTDALRKTTSLQGTGSSLAWRDITVAVPLDKKARRNADVETGAPPSKTILHKLCGYVEPSQVLFIMGPSGSGKSTILDALADRLKLPVAGTQLLDGAPKTPSRLKSVAKYVQQTDDLLGVLTVRETLNLTAALYVCDKEKRVNVVQDAMDVMGLTAHADTQLGNSFVRGLSGGQLRRVSIASELVAAPRLMFLDEPTSGLDSATAFHVMTELRRVAKTTSMALVITVHQPSELVFEMADSLLLISGGNTCYFGEANKASGYFKALGFEPPPRASEIEWMLDLINRDFGRHDDVDKCVAAWPTSDAANDLNDKLDKSAVPTVAAAEHKVRDGPVEYAVSFWQQTAALTKRGVINTIRNPAVLWLRFGMYLILSLMVGLVWLRLGTSAAVIIDTNNAMLFACAFMIFMSVSVLPAYLEERSVLMRERANGSYSVSAYILAHTLYEIPYVFLLALMSSSVTYWLVGLTPKFDRFVIFVANMFMSLFVAESMMVLISAIIPILIIGIAAGAMTFGLFMCLMGAFISLDRVGWWIRWVQYVALHFYSYSTFMVNQYRDVTYTAAPGNIFPPYPNDVLGNTVYRQFRLEERLWVNFVAQIAMVVVYRALAAAWLHTFVRGKR